MKCKKCHKEIDNLKICPYCKTKQISKEVKDKVNKNIDEAEIELKKVSFLNDPKIISFILIGLLFTNLILNRLVLNTSFIGYIFINIITIIMLCYFILLHFDYGKKKFKYMNIILLVTLIVSFITNFFNIFVEFNLINILNVISRGLVVLFFTKNFFKKDFCNIYNNIKSKDYFYLISFSYILYILLKIVSSIEEFNIINILLSTIDMFIMIFFTRYIYISYEVKSTLFKDISKKQEELDSNSMNIYISKIVNKFNFYQICSFITLILGIVLGIILGSKYNNCDITLYNNYCMGGTNFNFKVFFTILIICFLLSLFMYWQGEVIKYLKSIANNKKKVKKSVKNID